MSAPHVFVVAFEYAHRPFRCVRLEGSSGSDQAAAAAQWIVTLEGRTVWSFDAREGETRESVQRDVERWWDEARRAVP